MTLKEERMQVLKMLEEGKITAEEAATLLAALEAGARKEQGETKSGEPGGSGPQRRRRVRISVSDGTSGKKQVNINLPIGMIKMVKKIGKINANVGAINLDDIVDAVQEEIQGKVVDIQDDESGKRVEVYIE